MLPLMEIALKFEGLRPKVEWMVEGMDVNRNS